MNKRTLIISLSLVAVLALAATAFARHGYHGSMGYGHMGFGGGYGHGGAFQVAPEQQEAFDAIFDKHRDTMRDLSNQLWSKHMELEALTNSGQATKADIHELVQDISELREKKQAEHENFFEELDQAGIEAQFVPCRGFGPNGGGRQQNGSGPGSGQGYGSGSGSGQGYGPCNQ